MVRRARNEEGEFQGGDLEDRLRQVEERVDNLPTWKKELFNHWYRAGGSEPVGPAMEEPEPRSDYGCKK